MVRLETTESLKAMAAVAGVAVGTGDRPPPVRRPGDVVVTLLPVDAMADFL
jgi:hypothetical protein